MNRSANTAPSQRVAALLFFLLGIVTRLPFRSHILYHWDSVNFALALRHFDITLHQPHPPGTFMLYLGLGKLFTLFTPDENAALVWLAVLLSGLGVMGMYLLGERLFGREVGLLAGALSLTSPLVWFHGEVALSYILEYAWVPLVVYAVYRMESRALGWLLAASLLLGLSGGVRPNTPVFLFPLWAWGVGRNRYPWKQVFLLGVLPGALGALAWFVPMVALTGGLDRYIAVMQWWQAQHTAQSGTLIGIVEQSVRLAVYLFYALTAGVLVLLWGGWKYARRLPALLRADWRAQVMALWIVPGLLYLALIHIRQPGHTFTILPGVVLLTAVILDGGRWTVDGGRRTGDGGWGTMDSGQWTADGGQWTVDGERWTGNGGRRTVDDGRWTTDDGRWPGDEGRRTADGGRGTVDDGRWTTDGERRTVDDGRRTVAGGLWSVVGGLRSTVHGLQSTVYGPRSTGLPRISALILAANAAFFFFAPPYLFGMERMLFNTPSANAIRQYDAYVAPRLEAIRKTFDPATTAVLANGRNFRLPDYYLPDFQAPELSARFDVGEAVTELPPPIHTLVLFDNDVIPPLGENLRLQTLPLPDGGTLSYLEWTPGRTLEVSPQEAGVR